MALTIRWRALFATFKSPKPVWIFFGGLAAAVVVAGIVDWLFTVSLSATIRYAGMTLQWLGLFRVAVDLRRLRRQFRQPSLPGEIWSWFRQLAAAFVPPKPISAQASIVLGGTTLAGAGRVVRSAGPGASLESRVAILEEGVNGLRNELEAKEHGLRRELGSVRESIDHESKARQTQNQQTLDTIKDVAVGGLDLEFVGLVWLLLGVLGTSIPDEIARLICVAL